MNTVCEYGHLVEKLKKEHGGAQFICKNYYRGNIAGRTDRHNRACEVHAKAMMAMNPFGARWVKTNG